MNILFIHQNFPGQFENLAASLAANPKHKVYALGVHKLPVPAGVQLRTYSLLRGLAPQQHPLLREQEGKVLLAEACAAAAMQLKREGFEPDVIVAHSGWGEALFMKEVFPRARLVIYCEYYYALEGQDVGFDPEVAPFNFEQKCRLRMRNAHNLLSMEVADAAISPTQWQRSTYPKWAQEKITVIHDGIDVARLRHDPKAKLAIRENEHHGPITLKAGDEVLTYVARNLEPMRGFQVFMRTLPEVLKRRPKAHVVVMGGDERGYGHAPPAGTTWRQHLMAEVGDQLDMRRVHFVGKLPFEVYLKVLHTSRVHAYWTAPFVLSWSFLEAASSGLPVVASDTPPVREFAGRLGCATAGFFDTQQYAEMLVERLGRPTPPRKAVKLADIELKQCLKAQKELLLQA